MPHQVCEHQKMRGELTATLFISYTLNQHDILNPQSSVLSENFLVAAIDLHPIHRIK